MSQIYFIRHSLRDFSAQEDSTAPLTNKGLEKAEQLVKLFDGITIHQIFSSPYQRCIQTLAPLAQSKKLRNSDHL